MGNVKNKQKRGEEMSVFYRDIDVKISNYKSELSKPLVIFERDRGLEIYFNLVEYAYRLDKNPKNLLENLVGAYATVTLVNPDGYEISIDEVEITEDAKVKFIITDDLTDELTEIGIYQLQIHVNNDIKGKDTSVFSVPPFNFEVIERLKGKKSELFDSEGNGLTDKDGYQLVSATSNKIINFSADKINEYLNSIPVMQSEIKEYSNSIPAMQGEINDLNSQLEHIKNNHLILNIKDFGATGEEEQDVTEILKTMLNSITTSSATIKFPLGIYNITSEITLPNKTLTFIGEGVEGTIIKNSTGNVMRSFFFKEATNNKRFNCFKDIQFNCNKKVNRAIYFERGNGTKITHCRFINHLEAGVWFEAIESMSGAIVYESEVIGNYFRGVEGALNNNKAAETMPLYNIYCGRGATDSIFKDNISVNAQTHMFINGGNNMIRDNHFFDYPVPQYNSKCHIHLNGTSSILGNYFDSPTCGIKVTGERFLISNNNFFWGGEEIDRTNFTGISLELTTERKRGVVITNNFFNPIGSSVGYDIKVDCSLELPMIINNRSMNITNIYQALLMYSDGTTRKVILNGNMETTGQITGEFIGKISPNVGIIPTKTGIIIGNSTTPFKQITCEYSPKCNASNYELTSFPETLRSGQQELMNLIRNLGDRVKILENK